MTTVSNKILHVEFAKFVQNNLLENNIDCFLVGGSLINAVRDKGNLISDDIDFAIVNEENIEKFRHHNIMFSTTVSLYNIFKISELVEFTTKKYPEYYHGINIVNDVSELFIENTPPELRTELINDLENLLEWAPDNVHVGVKNIITILKLDNFESKNFTNFIKYTSILDKERGESILDVENKFSPYFIDVIK